MLTLMGIVRQEVIGLLSFCLVTHTSNVNYSHFMPFLRLNNTIILLNHFL